ncbi:hypothetical protein NC652_015506 [Populus alba x Populus x berolinensis]|nr:hypothetical protein NC652_015506 [Populus alba x Populus x berolinensis]
MELSGYNPKRQEFDPEYDNDAEQLLAEMEFKETDTEEERELKLRKLPLSSEPGRLAAFRAFAHTTHLEGKKVLFEESPPSIMVTRNPNWSTEILWLGIEEEIAYLVYWNRWRRWRSSGWSTLPGSRMKAMALCWTNDAASSCSAFSFAFFISVFTDCFRVPVAFEMMKMLAGFILTDFWVVPFMCRNEDNSKANSCPCVAEAFSDFCLSLCSRFCSPVYAGFFLCYLLSPGSVYIELGGLVTDGRLRIGHH